MKNEKYAKPNPEEFVQRNIFYNNKIQGIYLQNYGFFSKESNGETAFNFIYHAILKKAELLIEKRKNEVFINFISENNIHEYDLIMYFFINIFSK